MIRRCRPASDSFRVRPATEKKKKIKSGARGARTCHFPFPSPFHQPLLKWQLSKLDAAPRAHPSLGNCR
ncbi:hypothetical protein ACEN9Z_25230, partial [Stenotrophomonas geniculata]